ncbi:MAG: ECF transporter S component [Clostridiales bacterium]|nr:ECF transporter S component [Clostridiales bacterium]
MKSRTKQVTGIAMLAAIAYVVMLAGVHFMPSAPFLKYEPKDVILTIGGFLYGPLAALGAAFVVALIEMFTVSTTGIWGFVMNLLAAAAFTCTASLVYHRRRTARGAVTGLVAGALLMTGAMLLWNYLITPIYTGWPREQVAAMLVPVFLPFNLIKGCLNAAIILFVYKPLMKALRAARLLPDGRQGGGRADGPEGAAAGRGRVNVGLLLFAAFLLITSLTAIIVLQLTGK